MEQEANVAPDLTIIETRELCKSFGPTLAVDRVDLHIYRGQITGLIGENGSGKSTIASIIAGMLPATKGEMFYNGTPYKPSSMIEAGQFGIGMIVQEQGYVPGITIAQNIFLGEESRFIKSGFVSAGAMNLAAREALDHIGFSEADPRMYIDQLNLQDRKLVEIARVMSNSPEVLIVDETTTALSQRGREILYGIIRRMRDENKAVIFISHDLQELMDMCDTLTVLRDGRLVATMDRAGFSEREIKHSMVGRDLGEHYYRESFDLNLQREPLLEVDSITTGNGLLMNVSFQIQKGEILGIGGLSHCGMHELGKALFGDEPLLTGSIRHIPSNQLIANPRTALSLGMGYVSKDRDNEALVLSASIKDNIASAGLDKILTGPFIFPKKERDYVNRQVEGLSIRCASIRQNVQYLSGGNKQKVVFGKWIGRECDILILDCPTRGVDVGVKAAMYALMEQMKHEGKTIIMISEELAELIGMSDRLLILSDGKIAGEFNHSRSMTEQEIIECMI